MAIILQPVQQQPAQLCLHFRVRKVRRPFFRHNNQVLFGQQSFMAAEEFSEQALDAIAPHRLTETPGHHQSQPGILQGLGGQDDPEVTRVEPPALGLRP